jgi:hypothetical protein
MVSVLDELHASMFCVDINGVYVWLIFISRVTKMMVTQNRGRRERT